MRRMDDTHCGPEMPSLSKLTLLSELDGLLVSEALLRKVLIRRADFPEKQWFLGRPVPLFSPNSKSVPEPPASRASAPPPARTELPPSEVEDALAAIDPDALSPKEALDALYKLKALQDSQKDSP